MLVRYRWHHIMPMMLPTAGLSTQGGRKRTSAGVGIASESVDIRELRAILREGLLKESRDVIGELNGMGGVTGHAEREKTRNQILGLMPIVSVWR